MFTLTDNACYGIIRLKPKGGNGGGERIALVISFAGLSLDGGG